MRAALVIVPFVAACGSSAKPSTEGPGHEAPPAAAACPEQARLDELAARAWGHDVQDVWCVALRVGDQTQWWIAGYANDDAPDSYGWTGRETLFTSGGDVLWVEALSFDPYQPQADFQHAEDLDGDGTDEVVYVSTGGEGGGSSTSLVVVGIASGEPRSARLDLGFSYLDEGCLAGWRVEGATIVVTGDGECATFSGRYRWDGSTLVTE